MDAFDVAKTAELVVAEIYAILARYLAGYPSLRTLLVRMVAEEEEHARRVERWARAWTRTRGDRRPQVDVRPIDTLSRRAAAFCSELRRAEVIEAEAAVGLAICLEQKLASAHRQLAGSELGAMFLQLAEFDEDHLGRLLQTLTQLDSVEAAPELPCHMV